MIKNMDKEFKAGRDYIGVGGGVLIFNKKGEVLLMQRSKNANNQAGWWSKPGGTIEYGEKAIMMAKREIKEEIGIDIDIWGQLPHTDHIIKKEGQHWIAINFLADLKRGEPKNMEPHKCNDVMWFSLDNLPKKIVQNTREGIKYYKEKKFIKF